MSLRLLSSLAALLACLCFALPVVAQDLDAKQKAVLDAAAGLVKGAEGDLNAAKGSAGTAANPAKGSRLRLTKMRVAQAKPKLDKAVEYAAGLPAGNADVAALNQRIEAAQATMTEIEGILSGGGAPAPKPTPEQPKTTPKTQPKQPAGPAKLDYRQRETLKKGQYNLREAQGKAQAAAKVVERLDGEGEKPVHRDVRGALATLDEAAKKHGYARNHLEKLPTDHPDVAPTVKEFNDCANLIGALRSRLQAAEKELGKLAGMENYPNYQQDLKLVQELSRRYTNWDFVVQQPERLAQIIEEDGNCVKEIQRIAKIYQPLIDQKTPEGAAMNKQGLYCLKRRQDFSAKLKAYGKELPKQFESHLAEATKLADRGVAERKPMFFGPESGIEQQFGFAEQKLIVMRAFGEKFAAPHEKKLAETRKAIDERADSLAADIIKNNRMPSDNYRGGDRDDLVKRAQATWKKSQPDAKYLTARIPAQAWKRETKWEWFNGAFHKVDKSKIQIQLIVKHDDKLGVVRPVNLYKYHLENDVIRGYPFDGKKDKLQPHRFIPLGKIK